VHIHVIKEKRRLAHAKGGDDSEDYIASEGACKLKVSLISERVSCLETFIQKVFLFRFRFRPEGHPPGLTDKRLDQKL
jgi:hypothetical protein